MIAHDVISEKPLYNQNWHKYTLLNIYDDELYTFMSRYEKANGKYVCKM